MQDFIEERKKYFIANIQHKKSVYKGLPIYLTLSNENGDACYEKFAIGGENYHKTKKIDHRRIERFDWIFWLCSYVGTRWNW